VMPGTGAAFESRRAIVLCGAALSAAGIALQLMFASAKAGVSAV
jgi:hypothetical protein